MNVKIIFNFLSLILFAQITYAQAPQGIPYQAVARNSSGAILASANIAVRFTIRDSIATGTIRYRETFSVTTSTQGMINVNVGQGTVVSGSFAGVNWGTNAKFMQVEMDPAGGSSYIDMGTTQMMSVPYALNSGSLKLTVSATGDTLYSGGGNFVIIPGISAANCFVSAGTITGSSSVGVGTTVALSSSVAGGTWSSSNSSVASVGSTGIVTGIAAGTATITYTKTAACGSAAVTRVVTVNATALPIISTTSVGAIVSCAASSGGEITSDGGTAITARGVVWSTSHSPTIALPTKTNDGPTYGSYTGTYTSTISGLSPTTTYYVRAYATNAGGTAYGTEYSFTTLGGTMCIGATYGGGKIAYIFHPGDPGYVSGEVHGLIAAPSDQSAGIQWYNGGYVTCGIGTALGTGMSNTNTIVAVQGAGSYAAKLCYDLVFGGYSDWYLPSRDELQKLYENRLSIGGFESVISAGPYWSSSQDEFTPFSAAVVTFMDGAIGYYGTNTELYVRAVRSF